MAKALDLDYRPGESKEAYYRRLAKVADQRMVRLERLAANDSQYAGALQYAYRKAAYNIGIYSEGTGLPRWNTKPPSEQQLFNEKIASMLEFLRSPTSTKSGILASYKKRADTLNKRYGTNLTWQEVADYFSKGTAEKLAKEYGSKTVLAAIGMIQAAEKDILKGIERNRSVHMEGPVTDVALALLRKKKGLPDVISTMGPEMRKEVRKRIRGKKKS